MHATAVLLVSFTALTFLFLALRSPLPSIFLIPIFSIDMLQVPS
jgi:hypothetical protein